jgi:hypothetical protein
LKAGGGRALRARQTTKEKRKENETTTIQRVTFLREATRKRLMIDAQFLIDAGKRVPRDNQAENSLSVV